MAEELTESQTRAVENRGGRLLVSAAAGSGKTKVLVDRLMRYLTDPEKPANLDEFLIITYTKAAASELRGKIAAKLTERIALDPDNRHLQKQMQRLYLTQISTVHSFCSTVLKEYAYQADISPDFRVADESECAELRRMVMQDLMDRIYSEFSEDNHFRDFVDTQGVGRNDSTVPDIILKVYESARCHKDPEEWLSRCLTNMEIEGDASQCPWGQYLMNAFFDWLDQQIEVMRYCADRLNTVAGLEKPALNFCRTVQQMEYLRASSTWDEICARKNITFDTLRFPTKNNPAPELTEQVKAIREAFKSELEKQISCFANASAKIMEDLRQSADAAAGLIALVRQFDDAYTRIKRGRRVMDFSDLEHRTLDLLLGKSRTGPTPAADEIGARYREILVDEYQDSNGVQDAIFSVLTEKQQNCFMVGDIKQSIYQFRLADPKIFLNKYLDYADAENAKPGQGRKVLLSDNFRSGCEIIEGINDVFSLCMSPKVGGMVYGNDEALREGIPHAPLPDPAVELYVLKSEEDSSREEAFFIASRIRQMLDSATLIRDGKELRPVRAEDIVILLRSPNSAGSEYRKALEAKGLRCAMDSGMDLMKTEEVSTMVALLQIIINPRQDIPLLSALASPVFGFTADELAGIRSLRKSRDVRIFDALTESSSPRAVRFLEVLNSLRRKARLETLTELMQSIYLQTRIDSVYAAMPGGKARQENLQMFFRLAADYEKNGLRSLDQFLEHLEIMRGSGVPSAGSSSAGCVTIMSIHKSKGLEFPVVFLGNLSRKFNGESLQQQILCDQKLGLGLYVADNQNRVRYSSIARWAIAASMKAESLNEEIRVLYVAMTRARDRLIMTVAKNNPEKVLKDIARRFSADGGKLLCMEARAPGDWILTAAMQRIEAGELHAIGVRPETLHIAKYPWVIRYVQTTAVDNDTAHLLREAAVFPEENLEQIRKGLSFRYSHTPATRTPSKQTATGRKGRSRDEEANEDTSIPKDIHRSWRKPTFVQAAKTGTAYGNATHSAMQFLRYEACTNEETTAAELQRLVANGLLTEEQRNMVNEGAVAAFFETPVGRKLREGVPHIREFKFSILDDGSKYGNGLEGESVLLQGVVDCALLEPDGITVVDFKTDHVTRENLPQTAERYRTQMETYAEALTRIYEQPIKAKYLYFFHLNQYAEI